MRAGALVKRAPAPVHNPCRVCIVLKTLIKSNNIVLIGYVGSLLHDAGIGHVVLDTNMSVLEGSIGILPRRVMVGEDDFDEARQLLEDAGLGEEQSSRDSGENERG